MAVCRFPGLYRAFAWAEKPRGVSVLEQRCLGCHTGKYKKSGLDLSTRDLAIRGGDRGPAIVPGKSKESLLMRVASHAAEPHMPLQIAEARRRRACGAGRVDRCRRGVW